MASFRPPQGGLPSLADVRSEIAEMYSPENMQIPPEFAQVSPGAGKIFDYCMFVKAEDVPDDILRIVMLTTKILVDRHFSLSTESALEARASYDRMEPLRLKIVTYCLRDALYRPEEALSEIEKQIYEHLSLLEFFGSSYFDVPWLENLPLYARYGDVLVIAKKFDRRTREVLEHVLESAGHILHVNSPNRARYTALAHSHLALVLQELKTDISLQKEHTELAAKFFRRNRLSMREYAHRFLLQKDAPVHPVFTALGAAWFTERPSARDDRNSGKVCAGCMKSAMETKLFKCSQCSTITYCSRECQRSDWKTHKLMCKALVEEKDNVDDLRQSNPQAASNAEDMVKWRNGTHYANFEGMIHALNLQRDPSRGQSHIILRRLAHVHADRLPKDYRFRIKMTQCTVYKLEDVLEDIQSFQPEATTTTAQLRAGLKANIANMLKRASGVIPIIDLTFGPNISPCVNAVTVPASYVKQLHYDPDWRRVINGEKGTPPERFPVPSGALDAEFRF